MLDLFPVTLERQSPAGGGAFVDLVAGARYQRYLHIAEGWLPRVS
jgi:hypothetical protein